MQGILSTNNKFDNQNKFKNIGMIVISSSISNVSGMNHDESTEGAVVGVEGKQKPQKKELLDSGFQQIDNSAGTDEFGVVARVRIYNFPPSRMQCGHASTCMCIT